MWKPREVNYTSKCNNFGFNIPYASNANGTQKTDFGVKQEQLREKELAQVTHL